MCSPARFTSPLGLSHLTPSRSLQDGGTARHGDAAPRVPAPVAPQALCGDGFTDVAERTRDVERGNRMEK